MAKSLRSKRRRKVRAEKRIVNSKKELVKLKEIAAKLRGENKPISKDTLEAETGASVTEVPMIIDGESPKLSRKDKLTINNQWMNQRKIKSIKRKIKRHNDKKTRKGKSTKISSRKTKRSLK